MSTSQRSRQKCQSWRDLLEARNKLFRQAELSLSFRSDIDWPNAALEASSGWNRSCR